MPVRRPLLNIDRRLGRDSVAFLRHCREEQRQRTAVVIDRGPNLDRVGCHAPILAEILFVSRDIRQRWPTATRPHSMLPDDSTEVKAWFVTCLGHVHAYQMISSRRELSAMLRK